MNSKRLPTLLAAALTLSIAAPAAAELRFKQTERPGESRVQRAVIITENDTTRGIAAENAWIAQNHPGYRKIGQALIKEGGGIYDRIDIQAPDGSRRSVYFDIRSFFGLYNGKPLI